MKMKDKKLSILIDFVSYDFFSAIIFLFIRHLSSLNGFYQFQFNSQF